MFITFQIDSWQVFIRKSSCAKFYALPDSDQRRARPMDHGNGRSGQLQYSSLASRCIERSDYACSRGWVLCLRSSDHRRRGNGFDAEPAGDQQSRGWDRSYRPGRREGPWDSGGEHAGVRRRRHGGHDLCAAHGGGPPYRARRSFRARAGVHSFRSKYLAWPGSLRSDSRDHRHGWCRPTGGAPRRRVRYEGAVSQ